MKKWYGYAILGIVFCLTRSPQIMAQSLEGKVIEHTLENGLTLLLYERHQAPVLTCWTYVDAGSVDENAGETGAAHVLEHMAFKGTPTIGTTNYEQEKPLLAQLDRLWDEFVRERDKGEKADPETLTRLQEEFSRVEQEAIQYAVREYPQVITEHGGVGLNAATSKEATQYFVNLPANKLELWMLLEADRLAHPVFREFYKERDVVMKERLSGTDASPVGTLHEQFAAAAFIAHPYGIPIDGWASDLRNLTPAHLNAFYEEYYTASNMTVVIVGDIDPQATIQLVEKYFGTLPVRPKPAGVRTIEPVQKGERRISVEWDVEPGFFIGYHRPDGKHADAPVFEVISALLSTGRTSRFYAHLVEEQQIAAEVTTSPTYGDDKYPTLFFLAGLPFTPDRLEELQAAIYGELELLKTEPVAAEELQRVVNSVRMDFMNTLTSNKGIAEKLAYYHVVRGDWRKLERWADQIKAVTPEDIMRVANTYFTEQNRTIALLGMRIN